MTGLSTKVRWSDGPPRMRLEEAAVDFALSRDDDHEAFEALAGPVRARCTTPQRLLDMVAARPRISRRSWLVAVLTDVRDGSCSVLEQGYLTRVERAHGLPPGKRQRRERRSGGRGLYRDVDYRRYGVVVELDGRLVHEDPQQKDDDLDRDLDLTVEQRIGLRLGWGQVFRRTCATAWRVARILQLRGWAGRAVPCGPDCGLRDRPAA